MARRILIIQGHPDSQAKHFGHALADAYQAGAEEAGHEVKRLAIAELDVPVLRRREDWEGGIASEPIRRSQEAIGWAEHLVLLYPLWLGAMPALLKAFLEQVLRPGFAFGREQAGKVGRPLLTGKSARIIVTMGMPALVYRWYFGAHSLKSLERNVLGFCGVRPIRASLIGMVEAMGDAKRTRWMDEVRALGRAAR
ncbi:MAG TPA: NAD(P)H-dependent oxidoreductase [Burkholderiales bacterium]|nr:NAD(P)H-dependent oxidoreductase [Burkholderiales bacterium]